MSPWRAAIDQALLLQKQPGLAVAFRQAALPEGMAVLIRLASDEGGRRKDLAKLLELDEGVLQSAAADYLLTVCLYPDSSDLRTLGLNPSADLGTAKEHHRLLLKWLHPDRNPGNQTFAERVNQAWSAMKKSGRTAVPAPAALNTHHVHESPPSGRFPLFLWGLAGLAALLLALSAMPDSEIYVAESGPDAPVAAGKTADPGLAADAGALEKSIGAMKLSFGDIRNAVLPAEKPAKPKSDRPVKKTPVASDPIQPKAVQKTDSSRKTVAAETVIADKPPRSKTAAAPVAVQSKPENVPVRQERVAMAETPPPVAEPVRDLQAEGQAMIAEFRQRYRQGDIGPFMQLFSPVARNNRGDRQSIETDYARFFANSSSRKIAFSGEAWSVREDVVQFRAKYAATVRRKGELISETNTGRIELVLSVDNGNLRIQQILLGN